MNWLNRFLRGRRLDKQLDAELRFHFELQVSENMRCGMTEQQARRAARIGFGEMDRVKEDCRESRGTMWIHSTWQDLHQALRRLRRDGVFTAVAIVTLALGIGANTVVFSAVDHVLLRSLPYPRSDRVFAIRGLSDSHGEEPMQVSAADFYDWAAQSRTFESMSAYAGWRMNLTNVEDPRLLQAELVSANLFSTLGIHAEAGRTFLPEEDRENASSVVVISHRLWRSLGQSDSVVGTQLTLNGSAATVVGVMPDDFRFPSRDVDVWVPLSLKAADRANRDGRWLRVIGRLAPGSSRRDASSEMDVIARRLAAAYPAADSGWRISILPLQEEVVGKGRPILLTMQAAVFFLLLIACANLANLLLARAAPRTREIATRAALGASRFRIVWQLLVESVVLAVLGGGTGVALAGEGVKLIRTYGEDFIPRAAEIHLSFAVVLISVLASAFTAIVFGLAPALRLSGADLAVQIGSGAHGIAGNHEREKGILISVEVALAAVLLVGASLLGESLLRLVSTPTGYHLDHLLTMQLTLSRSRFPSSAAQTAFFAHVLERVRALPGVEAAAEISDTPIKGNSLTFELVFPGVSARASAPPSQAGLRVVSAGFFETAGISILRGRDFNGDDRADTMPVGLVNETMAHRYWPGADAVGGKVGLKDDQRWITVIGVVPDVKHMGLKENEGRVLYVPYAQKQEWLAWATLMVRTADDPMTSAAAARRVIRDLDRDQPVGEVGTLEDLLQRSTAIPRFSASVVCLFSILALMIALVGVYGFLSYTLAHRGKELAIRMTVGASPAQLCWLLFRQVMLRAGIGVAAGLLAAWWLARAIESLLFEIQAHDPAVFVGVAGVLLAASAAAVLIPAARVVKIDPATSLRTE